MINIKKAFCLIVFTISIFVSNVYAENNVDYTLTITDDFEFKEEINYSLTDYKQISNGYNYFNTIVNDDVYTDIFYNTKYTKTKKKNNGVYKVKLSHTYNEYSFFNSNFLNNCFEKADYKYDIDKYYYSGSDGFNCMRGDNLKITIITNQSVENTNATVSENKYVWIPKNEDFEMNIEINKKYKEYKSDGPTDADEDLPSTIIIDNNTENSSDDNSSDVNDNKSSINKTTIAVISAVAVIIVLIVALILKQKNDNINKL